MDNHYHLLMETPEPNLSQAGQWVNVAYSVWFVARERSVSKAILDRPSNEADGPTPPRPEGWGWLARWRCSRGQEPVARLVTPSIETNDARTWIGFAARQRGETPRGTEDWLTELRAGER